MKLTFKNYQLISLNVKDIRQINVKLRQEYFLQVYFLVCTYNREIDKPDLIKIKKFCSATSCEEDNEVNYRQGENTCKPHFQQRNTIWNI